MLLGRVRRLIDLVWSGMFGRARGVGVRVVWNGDGVDVVLVEGRQRNCTANQVKKE